jgi:hypothetical protein
LVFPVIFVLLIQKGFRSAQWLLNELALATRFSVSHAALTKARAKFKHTAFIELNPSAMVEPMDQDGDHKTFFGYRLLAGDGSKVQLPDTASVIQEWGTISDGHQKPEVTGEHAYGV